MPSFRHIRAMSNRTATWIVLRNGGQTAATQTGPKVELPENGFMKLSESQSLERILESAVIVTWADLMHGAQTGLIHIE